MTSSRFPGKILMELAGVPMLAQQVRRLKRCRRVDGIVIATTANKEDDPVVRLADREQVRWFRGDEQDVLSRILGAAREAQAEIVVRVTGDCPLLDPEVSDQVIEALASREAGADYASNVLKRTFPQGLDTEAMFMDTLERLNRLSGTASGREHVTAMIRWEEPGLFRSVSVTDEANNADLRWTVDVREDFETVARLYEALDLGSRQTGFREIVSYIRSHPEVMVNTGIVPA